MGDDAARARHPSDEKARPVPRPKSRHFSEPEIDHFVMAITSAEARVWHIPARQVERPHVAADRMGGL
jgi:hypothetical protein